MRPIAFDSATEALLISCHLPTSDLAGSSEVLFFGHASDGTLAGVVGLEIHGQDALLRSLAVAEPKRDTGLGTALVSYAEQQAAAHGASAVYLLTTTAERFFERRGYVHAKRSEAPAVITSTNQFSELCPSSSAFMVKQLDG